MTLFLSRDDRQREISELHQWARHLDTLYWAITALFLAGIATIITNTSEDGKSSITSINICTFLIFASSYIGFSFRAFNREVHNKLKMLGDSLVYITEARHWSYRHFYILIAVNLGLFITMASMALGVESPSGSSESRPLTASILHYASLALWLILFSIGIFYNLYLLIADFKEWKPSIYILPGVYRYSPPRIQWCVCLCAGAITILTVIAIVGIYSAIGNTTGESPNCACRDDA